jgi:hypothetical protein
MRATLEESFYQVCAAREQEFLMPTADEAGPS